MAAACPAEVILQGLGGNIGFAFQDGAELGTRYDAMSLFLTIGIAP